MKDKEKIKAEFIKKLREFAEELNSYTQADDGQWSVKVY